MVKSLHSIIDFRQHVAQTFLSQKSCHFDKTSFIFVSTKRKMKPGKNHIDRQPSLQHIRVGVKSDYCGNPEETIY
jgi:hypothetical protein